MAQRNYFDQFDQLDQPQFPQQGPRVTPLPPSRSQQVDETLRIKAAEREAQARADAAAKAERERREWEATHNPDGSLKVSGMTPDQQQAMRQGAKQDATLDSIVGQVNRVQQLYNSGIRDENLWNAFGALDAIGPSAGRFNSAGQGLADQGLAAFRVPGVGSQSDLEAAQFAAANTPQAGDWDQAIEEKLSNIRRRVDANRKALGLPPAQWTGLESAAPQNQRQPQAMPTLSPGGGQGGGGQAGGGTPSGPAPTPWDNSGPGEIGLATGNTRAEFDPETAGMLNSLVQRGRPYEEAAALATSRGLPPPSQAEYAAAIAWQRAHPNSPYNAANPKRNVPLSDYQQNVTQRAVANAQLPVDPTALALGAGQFLSGNTLDNMASNPEQAHAAMQLVGTASPGSTFAGEMAGGILGSFAPEAALGRLGMAPGFLRGIASDVTMGAANGAGMADNGNRLVGAAQGAAAAGVGSALGAGAMKAAGRMLQPLGGELRPLYDAGVRPTPGQRFANSGTAGRILNNVEQGLQSVPLVGQAIRGARQQARDQFQIGAFNEALSEIGETLPRSMKPGTDPHAFAQNAFNRTYEQARSAMRLVADEELSNDLGQLSPDISTLGPAAQRKLKAIMANTVNNRLRIYDDGTREMAGGAYKKAVSDLGKHTARLRNSPMAEDQALADVLDGVRGALDSAARRHSNPEAVQLLDAADAGYAKLVRIEDAAARRGGGAGVFSPANFDSAVQRTSGGVRSKAYSRGDALMQDYATAGRSLEDTLPDSGTTERAALGGVATGALGVGTGAGMIHPAFAGILGAIGTAYAPGARRLTTGAFAPAGPTRTAIARQLEKRARLLGRLGAAGAAASLPGTSVSR